MEWNDDHRRHLSWSMTISAMEEDGKPSVLHEAIKAALDGFSGQWVFQLERGGESTEKNEQGYLHWQVCLLLERGHAVVLQKLLDVFQEHGIVVSFAMPVWKNAVAAARYCSKNETRQDGPFWSSKSFEEGMMSNGKLSKQGHRTDLDKIRGLLDDGATPDDLVLDHTDLVSSYSMITYCEKYYASLQKRRSTQRRQVKVIYIWGPTQIGKTTWVFDHVPIRDLYSTDAGDEHRWDEYDGQPVLLLDEFRSQVPFSSMLRLLDGFPCQLRARRNNHFAAWSTVYIISNWRLEDQYSDLPDRDRAAFFRRIDEVWDKELEDAPTPFDWRDFCSIHEIEV